MGTTTAGGVETGNLSVTTGTLIADISGIVSSLTNHNTDSLNEGSTNQYFTNARSKLANAPRIQDISSTVTDLSTSHYDLSTNVSSLSTLVNDVSSVAHSGASPLVNLQSAGDISCLLYTSPSPRDLSTSRMPSSA